MDIVTAAKNEALSYDHYDSNHKLATMVNSKIAIEKDWSHGQAMTPVAVAYLMGTDRSYDWLAENIGDQVALAVTMLKYLDDEYLAYKIKENEVALYVALVYCQNEYLRAIVAHDYDRATKYNGLLRTLGVK